MLQEEVVLKVETHVVSLATFFLKPFHFFVMKCGKYSRAGQATHDNMAHALCMLDAYVCKLILRICNTY
jgi:hypothetical protein